MRAVKKEKISQGKKIDINDDTIKYEKKRRTPICELRELFTKKYRGGELAVESSFHAIREKTAWRNSSDSSERRYKINEA